MVEFVDLPMSTFYDTLHLMELGEVERQAFLKEMATIEVKRLVYIDETVGLMTI